MAFLLPSGGPRVTITRFAEFSLRKSSLALLVIFLVSTAVVEEVSAGWTRPNRWDLRTGYGYQYTNNSRPNNFQVISVMPSAVFQMTKPIGPAWFRGRLHWNPELDLAMFNHPYNRPKLGVTPLQFRWQWETPYRWKPYVGVGAGILYANVNRKETRHDLNFNLQLAVGLYFDLNEHASLISEYRHVHISNAGLEERNSGLNTHNFLVGVSIRN